MLYPGGCFGLGEDGTQSKHPSDISMPAVIIAVRGADECSVYRQYAGSLIRWLK